MSLADVRAAALFFNRKRRRASQDVARFRSLFAAPFDLGTAADGNDLGNAFTLPARGRLAISFDQITTIGQITVEIGSRTYVLPARAANARTLLPFGEVGEEVVISSAVGTTAGAVTLFVLDEWSRATAVATGTIT